MKAVITERGNGLPDVGDFVAGDDGEVYVVSSLQGPIHTGGPGGGDYIHARVKLADWSDVTDANEPTCSCSVK